MDIFQEYDCRICGLDYDLAGDRIVVDGEKFACPGCGTILQAGLDGPRQTIIPTPTGENHFEFRRLPADNAEKQAWLKEAPCSTPSA